MGLDAATRAPDPAAVQSTTAGRVRVLNDSRPLTKDAMPEEEVEGEGDEGIAEKEEEEID